MTQNFIPEERVKIEWDETKEGIILIRRGIPEFDLGDGVKWAMAKIRVADENHYVKGMCMYSDDLPDDADIVVYRTKFRSISGDLLNTDFEGILSIMPHPIYFGSAVFGGKGKCRHIHEIVTDDETWNRIQKEMHKKGDKHEH